MERWKPVNGFEGSYEISNRGVVKSVPRVVQRTTSVYTRRGRLLKLGSIEGYPAAFLWKDGKQYARLVHRMVAEAFIRNPKNKPEVNHKDGNKRNNRKKNLEWSTTSGNHLHAYATGLRKRKLTDDDVKDIRTRVQQGEVQSQLAREYSVSRATICSIVHNKMRIHIPEIDEKRGDTIKRFQRHLERRKISARKSRRSAKRT